MAHEYKSDDIVPESGVYGVTHDKAHKQYHEITCIEKDKFPPCAGCKGEHPKYVLKRGAIHIEPGGNLSPKRKKRS
jgi:hypothetical protein